MRGDVGTSDELEHLILQYKEDPNAHIKQSVLLDLLNLKPEQKSILTRTITATLPKEDHNDRLSINVFFV